MTEDERQVAEFLTTFGRFIAAHERQAAAMERQANVAEQNLELTRKSIETATAAMDAQLGLAKSMQDSIDKERNGIF